MTPGTYLRLRRRAAGLSIPDVAMLLAMTLKLRVHSALALDDIENDRYAPDDDFLAQLRLVFPFDRFIVAQLAGVDLGVPPPDLCRACGCSWSNPCDDERLGPCAWADAPRADGLRLCTHCLEKEVSTMPRTSPGHWQIHAQNCRCPRCAPWRRQLTARADRRAVQGGLILAVIVFVTAAAVQFGPSIGAALTALEIVR